MPHQQLLHKLYCYGVCGQTHQWIESILLHKTQQVVVEGQVLSAGQVTSGVLQGSDLGMTLFLIYIIDLSKNIKFQMRLFADDTILYHKIKSQRDSSILQEDLDQLNGGRNDKCPILTVSRKRKPISTNYSLHGQVLRTVEKAKSLGMELTEDLNWGPHIQTITAKVNRTTMFTHQNLRGSPITIQTKC